jgi:hypothetical protein
MVALVGVWLMAALGIWLARSQRMTAAKATDYLAAHPLTGRAPAEREQIIDGMADRVNRLSFEERQKFRYEGDLRAWFESLTAAERSRYIERTLPKGMEQLMKAFNDMSTPQRKQLVNRALNDLERFREDAAAREAGAALNDASLQRLVEEGMRSFIRDASADTKLDLQPLIEQMQSLMQGGR